MGFIYIIVNLIDFKVYIGKWTKNRVEERLNHYRNAKSHNPHLNRAIKKYGVNNFLFGVLHENVPHEKLNDLEIKEIARFDCNKNRGGWGYNETDGGEGTLGNKWTPEQREKMSGKNHPFYGKKRPNFSGKNHPFYGKTHSEDTKRKISGKNHHNYGKTPSEETRCKLSKANRARRRPEYYEAKWCFVIDLHGLPIKDKRKQLFIKYPDISRSLIYEWVRQWQSELAVTRI